MNPTAAIGIGLAAILYLTLSVFQSAAAASRPGPDARRGMDPKLPGGTPGGDVPSARLLLCTRAARQILLVAAALLASGELERIGAPAPLWLSFAATSLVFVIGLDQIAARAVVLVAGRHALRATILPARIVSAPLVPIIAPARRALRGLWRLVAPQHPHRGGEAGAEPDPWRLAEYDAEPAPPDPVEGELITNVTVFSDTLVREIMTPRTDMVSVEEGASQAALAEVIGRVHRSRIPLTRGGADHVVGFVHARDLLALWERPPEDRGVQAIMRSVLTVPDSQRAQALLREMQAVGAQMAIVVDEYGGTAGLITIEDLLEELVGEIADEHDNVPPAPLELDGGALLMPATFPLFDLAGRMQVTLPEVEADTVGGLVSATLGRLPERGDSVDVAGLRFTVDEADRRRVRRVRVERVPEESASPSSPPSRPAPADPSTPSSR